MRISFVMVESSGVVKKKKGEGKEKGLQFSSFDVGVGFRQTLLAMRGVGSRMTLLLIPSHCRFHWVSLPCSCSTDSNERDGVPFCRGFLERDVEVVERSW